MTTNQTIDGVPRVLIEKAMQACFEAGHGITHDELRALLDAPVLVPPKRLGVHHVLGAIHNVPGFPGVKGNHIHDLTALLNGVLDEYAAQPQGEPVAWIKPDVAKTLRKDERCYAFGSQNPKGTLIPLYAEQPAPVAVEYKLHMGDALKVFDAIKVKRIARSVDLAELGPMGAVQIETWTTAIGLTLEMHTAMGGCTLIVRASTS